MNNLVKLSELADLTVGYVGTMGKEYSNSGVLLLRSLNVKPFSFDLSDVKYIHESFEHTIKKSRLKENDVVIVRTGVPGTCSVIPKYLDGCNCADLVIVRPNNKLLDSYYLCCFINTWGKAQVTNSKVGAIQKHFNISSAEEMLIPYIDLENQKSASKIIKLINDLIANNNSVCSDLEAIANLIYDYWFVQFDFPNEEGKPYKSSGGKMVWSEELKREIPEGWDVDKLEGHYQIDRGISYSTANIESGKGIPMINLACVDKQRRYRDGELKYYSGDLPKSMHLRPGEMLIACTDLTREREIIGCPILVPDDGEGYTFSMDMAKITFPSENINDLYMYMSLRTNHYHDFIKQWATGTNVLHLNLDGLNWYTLPFPPISLQKKYADIVSALYKKNSVILSENRQLSSLRDFLLPMLMNGQVKIG